MKDFHPMVPFVLRGNFERERNYYQVQIAKSYSERFKIEQNFQITSLYFK